MSIVRQCSQAGKAMDCKSFIPQFESGYCLQATSKNIKEKKLKKNSGVVVEW